MNRTGKVVLISLAGLVGICLCLTAVVMVTLGGVGGMVAWIMDTDQATVTLAGDEIAEYAIPEGFDEGAAVSVAGFSMVTYTHNDGRSHINLIQEPSWLDLDREDLERQMSQASGAEEWTEVEVVESQPCQIRGQETTLVVSEGVSHDNRRYRTASALFEGKGGLALLNISAPSDSWDQEMVDSFIESVH